MSSPRYNRIALGSALSPRFLPLLAEANAICQRVGAELHIIHAGTERCGKEEVFRKAFQDLHVMENVQLHIAEGGPVGVISREVEEQKIDLLILGALERESDGRHFLGNVARSMMRAAKCSVFFFVRPDLHITRFRRLTVICDYSPLALESLRQAIHFAEQYSGCTVEVLRVLTIFDQIRKQGVSGDRKNARAREEEKLIEFVQSAGETEVELTIHCLECTTGFAASEYVIGSRSDLLVIPVGDPDSPTFLPSGLDWLESTIPTNLFLVRG